VHLTSYDRTESALDVANRILTNSRMPRKQVYPQAGDRVNMLEYNVFTVIK